MVLEGALGAAGDAVATGLLAAACAWLQPAAASGSSDKATGVVPKTLLHLLLSQLKRSSVESRCAALAALAAAVVDMPEPPPWQPLAAADHAGDDVARGVPLEALCAQMCDHNVEVRFYASMHSPTGLRSTCTRLPHSSARVLPARRCARARWALSRRCYCTRVHRHHQPLPFPLRLHGWTTLRPACGRRALRRLPVR